MVALSLVAAGGAYGYVRFRIDSIRTRAAPHLTGQSGGASKPENILLIGNQTRAGLSASQAAQFGSPEALSGSLSDVIMILHVDPTTGTAAILSIPRDLFVPMPPGSPVGSYQKIDAALNDGANGPDNLIQAITSDFGIPINHYVELNFNGFASTVNALGGINVDFPEPVWDANSLLWVPTPGCRHLDGFQALALVRARHLQYAPPGDTSPRQDWPYDPESDLSRIVRDHTFLRILFATAISKGLTNPITLNSFLGAIIDQITIDPGLKGQLLALASRYRHLSPNAVPETTLPIVTVTDYHYNGYSMGDVDFPVQPVDNQTIAAWDHTALPAPVTPTAVNVYNVTGVGNLAHQTSAGLAAFGLPVGTIANGPVAGIPAETMVHYQPGATGLAQALSVVDHLVGPVMLQADPNVPAGSVNVDAGTGLTVATPVAPGSPGTASGGPAAAGGPSASGAGVEVNGQKPSPVQDQLQPWDPRPCPA